jgi:GT2 family glycosyltransferase/glycosyltransferase involved in cell wall biosynthesis
MGYKIVTLSANFRECQGSSPPGYRDRMVETALRRVPRRAKSVVRKAISRAVGVPLHEHATAAQDDRPSRELVREIARLRVQNLRSRRSVVDPASEAVVTMTTHGDRIRLVWVALESIARGTALPRRLILFLDAPELAAPLPAPLRRLQRRGLEILPAQPGLKVHAKYWPYVASILRHELPLVVSDDDMVYPSRWLRVLVDAHWARPELVHAFRAHEIPCSGGSLRPYREWQPARGTAPSFAHFGTGVSGQILPPHLLDRLRDAGEAFLERSPTADDVWINAVAVRNGIRTAQVEPQSRNFPFVPATQATGLYRENVAGGLNDLQLQRSLSTSEIERICSSLGVPAREPRRRRPPTFVSWGRFTDNPWQDIIEAGAAAAGLATVDLDHGASLEPVLDRAADGLAVHVNWTAPITHRAATEDEACRGVDELLAQIDALQRAGGALIWTIHNVAAHEQKHPRAERRLLSGLAARADVVHTMHPRTAAAMEEVWGIRIEREANIAHPSYLGLYPDVIDRASARAALGIPEDRTVVLLHGALREYKGVDALVDGFLAAQERRGDLHLLIAGRPGVGFDSAALEARLAHRADVTVHADHVPVDEVQRWHRAADVLAMPYRDGLNSGALQLAATFSLPVIAFPCMAVERAEEEGWAAVVDPARGEWLLDGLAALQPDAGRRAAQAALERSPEAAAAELARVALDAIAARSARLEPTAVAVIVSFGSAGLIERGLAPLLRRMRSVVVENPTDADEHARLERVAAVLDAELLEMHRNVGFGAAVRAGVKRALEMGARHVLLLNPDVRADPAAIERMLARASSEPEAIVAPRIHTPDGRLWFDGGVIDWDRGIARHRRPDEAQRALEWLTGACLLVPIHAWDRLGGFDDDYFLYWEDVDFTHRWLAHGTLAIEPSALVVHEVGGTQGSRGKSLGYTYYNARNRMLFAARHLGARGLARWVRSAPSYHAELLARSGAGDEAAREEHRAAAVRGTRNGTLRGIERLVRPRSAPND